MKIKLVHSFTKKPFRIHKLNQPKTVTIKRNRDSSIKTQTVYFGAEKHGACYYFGRNSGVTKQTARHNGTKWATIMYFPNSYHITITIHEHNLHYEMAPTRTGFPCWSGDICRCRIKPSISQYEYNKLVYYFNHFIKGPNKSAKRKYKLHCSHINK